MSEAGESEQISRPETGDPLVDAAVAGLEDLDRHPLAEHHDRLQRAHEQLHAELSRDHQQPDGSMNG